MYYNTITWDLFFAFAKFHVKPQTIYERFISFFSSFLCSSTVFSSVSYESEALVIIFISFIGIVINVFFFRFYSLSIESIFFVLFFYVVHPVNFRSATFVVVISCQRDFGAHFIFRIFCDLCTEECV